MKFENISLAGEKNSHQNNGDKGKRIEKEPLISRRDLAKGAIAGGILAGLSLNEASNEKVGLLENALKGIGRAFERFSERKTAGESEKVDKPRDSLEVAKNIKETQTIADHYYKAFEELKLKEEFFPKDIFTRDLLIAQQLQESGYRPDARSKAGALGVMQNMDISIKDVSLFLVKLSNQGIIEYSGPVYIPPELEPEKQNQLKERLGTRVLTDKDLVALEYLRVDNPDYSRALGKLYLMQLWSEEHGYGAGQDKYKKGRLKDAQAEILGAYNAGLSRVKNKPRDKWIEEPRQYVERIFNYMERLQNVRATMRIYGLDKDNDAIAMRIAREMNKVRGQGRKRQELLDFTMNHLAEEIKKEEEKRGGELSEEDIIHFFSKYEKISDIHSKSVLYS